MESRKLKTAKGGLFAASYNYEEAANRGSSYFFDEEVTREKLKRGLVRPWIMDFVFDQDKKQATEAIDFIIDGKLPKRVEEKVKASECQPASYKSVGNKSRRRRRKSEFDGEVDIDSYLSGDPEYYRKVQKVNKPSKIMDIYIIINVSSSVTGKEIEAQLTKIAQKVYGIIQQGHTTRITSVSYSGSLYKSGGKLYDGLLTKVIKEPNKPFDVRRLFALAIPATYRYFSFVAKEMLGERSDITKVEMNGGYPGQIGRCDGAQIARALEAYGTGDDYTVFTMTNGKGYTAAELREDTKGTMSNDYSS